MFRRLRHREEWQRSAEASDPEVERPSVESPRLNAGECRKLMRFVPRRSAVRRIAEHFVAAPDVPIDDLQPLTRTLLSRSVWRWRERRLAAWLVGEIYATDQAVAPATEALVRVVERRAVRGNAAAIGRDLIGAAVRAYLLALALTPLVVVLLQGWWMDSAEAAAETCLLLSVPLFPSVWGVSNFVEDMRKRAVRREAIAALGKLARPETLRVIAAMATRVGPFWWSVPDTADRGAASAALPPVVANLRPEHYGALPAGTVAALCKLIGHNGDRTVMAALTALRIVGDGSAVQPVSRLARRAKDPAIRAAAEDLVPILLERQRNEMAQSVLLRPSSAPSASPEELLRPAASGSDTSPDELLRASAGETPTEDAT
jgi:hypothetical protein